MRSSTFQTTENLHDKYWEVKNKLEFMHGFLMKKKFPYHSVSVIHSQHDLGYHCYFTASVKDKVEEIKEELKRHGFTYSITQ